MLRESCLTDDQRALLNRFKEAGGVVEHYLLEYDESDILDDTLLRRAAILGMELSRAESIDYAKKLGQMDIAAEIRNAVAIGKMPKDVGEQLLKSEVDKRIHDAVARRRVWTVEIDAEKTACLSAKRIDQSTFLGPCYEAGRHCLTLPLQTQGGLYDWMMQGYAYAFSQPPYSLHERPENVQQLFHSFLRDFLHGLSDEVLIHQWPTDWANFFDAGKEWWGCFLWTVTTPALRRIAWIGASTTD